MTFYVQSPKIDWITATSNYVPAGIQKQPSFSSLEYADWGGVEHSRVFGTDAGFKFVSADKRYQVAVEDMKTGIRWDLATRGSNAGAKLTLSGSVLDKLDDRVEALRMILSAGYRVSRIDVATDVLGQPVDWNALDASVYERWHGKRNVGRRTYKGGGKEITIGSRKGEGYYVRIYDKGAEQQVEFDWTRLEVEIKGKPAHQTALAIADIGSASHEVIVKWLDMPGHALVIAIDEADYMEQSLPVFRIPRPKGTSEAWLERVVIPYLKRLARENPALFDKHVRPLFWGDGDDTQLEIWR